MSFAAAAIAGALPGIQGIEAAGMIEDIGAGLCGFAAGGRIANVTENYTANASERVLPPP